MASHSRIIGALAALIIASAGSSLARVPLSDAQIRQAIILNSIAHIRRRGTLAPAPTMSPGTDRNAVAEARIAAPAALSRCVTRGMSATAWSRIGDGRIGTELENPRLIVQAVRDDAGGTDHPFLRDVGEPRFVFRIAATDVGMDAGKPDPLEVQIAKPIARCRLGRIGYPRYALEISAVLVDRDRMLGVDHVNVQCIIRELVLWWRPSSTVGE